MILLSDVLRCLEVNTLTRRISDLVLLGQEDGLMRKGAGPVTKS